MSGIHSGGVLVHSENQELRLELLAAAKSLAGKLSKGVSAALIGSEVDEEGVQECLSHGADQVYTLEDPSLDVFSAETHSQALVQAVSVDRSEAVLVGGTRRGKALAPRVAASLETGCMTDCVALDIDGDRRLVGTRLTYGGSALARMVAVKKPQVATVPAKVFPAATLSQAVGRAVRLRPETRDTRLQILERMPRKTQGAGLENAEIVVACGRAIKRKEDLGMMDELAAVMGAELSCTRPLAADMNWMSEWVGLSGHKIRPKLYLSCGISGTIQHVAGIRDAKTILAINSDETAPIFNCADYGVVGDVYKIVPLLTARLKEFFGA